MSKTTTHEYRVLRNGVVWEDDLTGADEANAVVARDSTPFNRHEFRVETRTVKYGDWETNR